MSRILGMGVTVTVVLAQRDMAIENILETTVGTIIEFDVMFDAELILEVGGQPIGKGQAVKVGENFGLRIVEMGSIEERITAMGQS